MPGVIVVTGREAATNTDILQGTRLQTVPRGGFLTFEIQADNNDATNSMTVSIQLPSGDTPFNGVFCPTGVTGGALNVDDKLQATFGVGQGGHAVFSCTETGAAIMDWRVTYRPAS